MVNKTDYVLPVTVKISFSRHSLVDTKMKFM
jgi:hypothetical protein